MNPTFAARLAERVASTFLIAFIGTYVNVLFGAKGTDTPVFGQITAVLQGAQSLSLLHKAVLAGGLALFQMLLGFLGSRVGDPNSPAFIPKRLEQPGLHEAPTIGRYAASDELQHTLQQAAAANPNEPLTTDAVLAQIQTVRSVPPEGATPAT